MSIRARSAFTAAVVASLSLGTSAFAQPGGAPNTGKGPQLPKSGTIPRDSAREQAILALTKAPAGSKVTMFAGPPVAMYPTAVATSSDGSVYVGVDLNLAQGAVPGRGRVMRLKDTNNDGHADEYTVFTEVESPRGIIADGKTVYIMHPPNLTAYRDTNGDGIADESDDLVKGLGFGLDVRSSDHSTNNITMGIDGYIYVAVGDYGYANAVGKDGTTIKRHGGSIVRVRPDGTGLEVYATGTRNTYDVGIDPFMHVFARDNTNDGGGWNTRFHYLPPLAEMGYPSLFLNFPDETMQTLFDFGAGSGTGGLWIQDPGFPAALNNQLYTSDWTVNKILFNPVTKKGASYTVKQEDYLEISHALDFTMDDQSHMFVASLIGGVFNYAGDTVGAILRVEYPGNKGSAALNPTSKSDAQLIAALLSNNSMHRLWAQRELVQRKLSPTSIASIRAGLMNAALPPESRAAALFTLPLVTDAQAALKLAARDPVLREVALRTMVDDKKKLTGIDVATYVAALKDTRPGVQVQGINGLVRLNAKAQAEMLVPLLASPDSALSHLSMRALAKLEATDVALKALNSPMPVVRTRARFALQLIHSTANVNALIAAYNASATPPVKSEILAALARLYNTDAPWNGDWWGTHPTNVGPYFAPVVWEGSPLIKPVLRNALATAQQAEMTNLAMVFAKNRVIPLGSMPLLMAVANTPDKNATLDALVGSAQLTPEAIALITRLDGTSAPLHTAVARLLAGETELPAAVMPLARKAVVDANLSDSIRGGLLTTIAAKPGAPDEAAGILAQLNPAVVALNSANIESSVASVVETSWRRYVGARERTAQIDYFIGVTKTGDSAQKTLAYAILLQSVRGARVQAALRDKVQPVIAAGWTDATNAQSLARAVRIMRLETQYAEQLKAVPNP